MALSDAKGDVDDRVRDLAAAERELEKADFDLRYKTHEAKIVNKAAVAKRTEVGEVTPHTPLPANSAYYPLLYTPQPSSRSSIIRCADSQPHWLRALTVAP